MTDAMPLLAAFVFLIAGLIKGVIGFGLPTVAMGLLGLGMAPAEAAALLLLPSAVTNAWQLAAGPGLRALLRRLWPMQAGVVLGTVSAGWAGVGLGGPDADGAATALGVALLGYAAFGLAPASLARRLDVPARAEAWLGPLVGAATGIVTAATGVFVLPAVPYLQALGLPKDDLVQALGLSFTVSTAALALGLAGGGALDAANVGASLLALAPALAGMALGQRLRARIAPALFRRCVFLGLLALGAYLTLRGTL